MPLYLITLFLSSLLTYENGHWVRIAKPSHGQGVIGRVPVYAGNESVDEVVKLALDSLGGVEIPLADFSVLPAREDDGVVGGKSELYILVLEPSLGVNVGHLIALQVNEFEVVVSGLDQQGLLSRQVLHFVDDDVQVLREGKLLFLVQLQLVENELEGVDVNAPQRVSHEKLLPMCLQAVREPLARVDGQVLAQ